MTHTHWWRNRRGGAVWATPRSTEGDGPLPAGGANVSTPSECYTEGASGGSTPAHTPKGSRISCARDPRARHLSQPRPRREHDAERARARRVAPAYLPLVTPAAERAHGADLDLPVVVPGVRQPTLPGESLDPQHRPVRRNQASRVEIPPPHHQRVARAGLTEHHPLHALGRRSRGAPRQDGDGRSRIG